jgi:hypothetical protein
MLRLVTSRLERALLLPWLATLPLFGLCACSGSSSDGDSQGAVTFALTDAAADQVANFFVEIEAIQLERASGALVSLLTQPVRVDLTELQDLSQVLGTSPVPLGLYTGAQVTFDFSDAEVFLVGQSSAASLLDEDGDPLNGLVPFDITLQAPFSMGAGAHKLIELDFDLNQSVEVDSVGNSVRVEPKLVLGVDPQNPKELISLGEVQSVDAGAGTFQLDLQTLQGVSYGSTTVSVLPQTVYQINGVPYTGNPGLDALAGLPAGTWVQTYGAIAPSLPNLTVVYVEAGTGTYNGGQDIIEGHVVGRIGGAGSNPTLVVRGHSNNATHDQFQFDTFFTVDVAFAQTKVLRRGSATPYDADDINIGQRVRIFGDLIGTDLDATATDGVVRLQPTRAMGFASAGPAGGQLTVDLVRIGLMLQGLFSWNESGLPATDPDALVAQVDTAADGLGIEAGTAVELLGWFTAIDAAGADFEATAVINRDLAPSLLLIKNRPGGLVATLTSDPTQLQVSLSGNPTLFELAIVDKGFVGIQNLPSSPTPTITSQDPTGLFTLVDKVTGSFQVFSTLAALDVALSVKLAQGADLYDLGAIGPYTAQTNTLAAKILTVVVD